MSLGNELIPDDEDISYNISVKNKRYEAIFYQQPAELSDTTLLREKLMQKELMKISFDYMMDLCSKKPVWFMISELYGKYYITMFYDNEYNRANGEDL